MITGNKVLWLACLMLGLFFPNFASGEAVEIELMVTESRTNTSDTDQLILVFYDKLQKLTENHSPDISIIRDFMEQKIAEEYSAKAKRWSPGVDLELSRRRSHHLTGNFSGLDDEKNESNWNFILDWPVYRRPLVLQAEKSDLEAELAKTNLTIKTEELDINLRTLIAGYLVKAYQLLNLQNSINHSLKHLKGIETGYQMRHQTKLQLLRAQANLNVLEAKKDIYLQQKKESLRRLVRLTGLESKHTIFADFNTFVSTEQAAARSIVGLMLLDKFYKKVLPWLDAVNETELQRQFISNSLLYKKVILEKKIAYSRAETIKQADWPDLSVKGSYQKRDNTEFNDWKEESSIGIFLTVPIFSGGTSFSNYHAKKNARQIALTTKQDNIKKIFFDIMDDRQLIIDLKKVFKKKKILLQQQEEIVLLSVKSYTLKKTSMQDLLTSLNTLIDVKNDLMYTTIELGIAIKRFAWKLGLNRQDRE
jgi:outer membrane protein TolC